MTKSNPLKKQDTFTIVELKMLNDALNDSMHNLQKIQDRYGNSGGADLSHLCKIEMEMDTLKHKIIDQIWRTGK